MKDVLTYAGWLDEDAKALLAADVVDVFADLSDR